MRGVLSEMCGRFTQKMSWKQIVALYQMPGRTTPVNLRARANGCPTQDFAACRLDAHGQRTVVKLRWGLVPRWAKDVRIGSRLINARSETVHQRPAFRHAFRRQRCLVPADGWFEWRPEGNLKQPYFISAASRTPVSFAALWDRWDGDGELIESFTILTTAASPAVAAVHHRQPVIIEPGNVDEWLEPDTPPERLLDMARRAYEGPYSHWPVSTRVNSARNDDPDLLQPLGG